jgi:hypothetical protein
MPHKILILVLLFSQNFSFSQSYFPPANQSWETKNPKVFNLKKATLDNAIDFAKSNEYSGERDLRIAILKGFAKEPYHQILGPTKKAWWASRYHSEKRVSNRFLGRNQKGRYDL